MIQFKLYAIKNLTTGQLQGSVYSVGDDPKKPRIFRKKYAAKAWINSNKQKNQPDYKAYWGNNEFEVIELNCTEIKGE